MFPPEFPPPRFEWRDPAAEASEWRVDITFADGTPALRVQSHGEGIKIGELDARCISPTNEPPELTPDQAVAHTWRPDAELWAVVKKHSVDRPARVTITGLRGGGASRPVSQGQVSIVTSTDPVGAPVFYRDVPLMPSELEKGVIKPLAPRAVPLIAWRIRNIGETSSHIVLTGMPTCANCHSFSRDGKTLGMDLDGPRNEKGLYSLASIRPRMSIRTEDVIEWRSVKGKLASPIRVGFMSQVSPDGQYVVTTINPSAAGLTLPGNQQVSNGYYVANFKDYRFLQVFYPTRGVLAWYNRASGWLQPLPGASDPRYVQLSAFWSPDGKYLVFGRAEAKDPYSEGSPLAAYANDPNETQIHYDLYRIPFNNGKGGTPEPIPGASENSMSNSFPKISPDGRWIVFVKARNGQLMRPDSELYIVPAQGGTARRMRCNTALMNSWHSFSPNGRWLVFSSKSRSPYTQMYLTHIDEQGNDTPAVLIENSTPANRAVNIPEFVNISSEGLEHIDVPAVEFYREADKAYELVKKGETAAAVAGFEKAMELEPQDARARNDFGITLEKAGRMGEAIAQYKKALETDPRNADAYFNLGSVEARGGQLDDAISNLEQSLRLNPGHELAEGRLCGALALSERRHADALSNCARALALNPGDGETQANYAIALASAGRPDEALAHLEKAVQLMPGNAGVHGSLGAVLARQGRLDAAAAQFERALQLDPNYADGHRNLAILRSQQGRSAEALAHWRALLRLEPDNVSALSQTARLLATDSDGSLRNGAEAVTLAERAVKLSDGREAGALDALASAYAEAGRFPEAVQTERRAIEIAKQLNDLQLVAALTARMALYQAGKPMRQQRAPGPSRP
jgi:tetratricopeptide (TPR) repeat protein